MIINATELVFSLLAFTLPLFLASVETRDFKFREFHCVYINSLYRFIIFSHDVQISYVMSSSQHYNHDFGKRISFCSVLLLESYL